jgi:hypothetical protein
MEELIALAKGTARKSLATVKPKEIIDFQIKPDEREWKKEWLEQLRQLDMFEVADQSGQRKVIRWKHEQKTVE